MQMTADVAAAAVGLLAARAEEVVVLDNHLSGNPENILGEALPAGARPETWNVFDLVDGPEKSVARGHERHRHRGRLGLPTLRQAKGACETRPRLIVSIAFPTDCDACGS
jgi:hypothetical protein